MISWICSTKYNWGLEGCDSKYILHFVRNWIGNAYVFVASYYIPLKSPLCPGSDLLEAIRGFPCGLHSFASASGYFYPLILPPTVSLSPSDF